MKFCAVICEYNPFHNGHAHQLAEIKRLSGCDAVLCLMSGNFTQRGEPAVLGKYTRARHAVENGADVVLELPTAFAVAPAEIFAQGALHILGSIRSVTTLAFGCESGTKEDFLRAARATLGEDKRFRSALKEAMKDGTSYAKARTQVVLALNSEVDEALLTSPNNMLGTEYCRAILATGAKIEPLPIPRVGGGYADTALRRDFSSAAALRSVLGDKSLRATFAKRRNLPADVYASLSEYRPLPYPAAALCALIAAEEEDLALTPDCSEGLENRLKALVRSNPDYDALLGKVVSKRYTRSRIKRILLQNFLGIRLKNVKNYIEAPLYLRTLAVKKDRAEELLSALSEGFPLLARKGDAAVLKKDALACFSLDVRANGLYSALSGTQLGDYETLFV